MPAKQQARALGIGAASLLMALAFYLLITDFKAHDSTPVPTQDSVPVPEPRIEFGLAVDAFDIHRGQIKPNQFLADILLKYGISYQHIDRLVKAADSVFNVKKMQAGKNYTVYCARDSTRKAVYFVYQPSLVDYVVFDMRDSIAVYTGKKPVIFIEKAVTGKVNSSLWETMKEAGASPVLALELSEIYAWTIDFYRIQQGDRFKAVYREGFVDGQSIGIGRVLSAVFTHKEKDFYAFWFRQDSVGDYFDENGMSLRKAFLKMPLKFGRLTSSYSTRRFHPVQKRYKPHLGTDYAAPTGTPILAVGDGLVEAASWSAGNGKFVKIRHSSTYTTQYLHMSKRAVKTGDYVKQGDVIGYVGSSGLATGPHVCFRFWKNGKQVDHRQEEFPPAGPVEQQHMDDYRKVEQKLRQRLDSLAPGSPGPA